MNILISINKFFTEFFLFLFMGVLLGCTSEKTNNQRYFENINHVKKRQNAKIIYGIKQDSLRVGKWVIQDTSNNTVIKQYYSYIDMYDTIELVQEDFFVQDKPVLSLRYKLGMIKDAEILDTNKINEYFPNSLDYLGSELYSTNCFKCHWYNPTYKEPFFSKKLEELQKTGFIYNFLRDRQFFSDTLYHLYHPDMDHLDSAEINAIVSHLKLE